MERRGFLGTIMGAAAAVFAPIPVGENKIAQYAEPVKHIMPSIHPSALCGSGIISNSNTGVLTACSGSFLADNNFWSELERKSNSYKYKDMWDGYERT